MAGFSYRGKNIEDFGAVYYIPNESERGQYALPYDVEEQEVNGRDGAYYYGNRVEPRQFDLRCYYEDLTQQTKEDIMRWFGRNTKGRLIFDDRPGVYYDVIPNDRLEFDDYRGMSCDGMKYKGILTIHLKAYCPFGKLLPSQMVNDVPFVGTAIVGVSIAGSEAMDADNETIILFTAQMPSSTYDVSGSSFYIYNPGTEPTPLQIRIAGTTTNDAIITNVTNGQTCAVRGMTAGNTTSVNKYLKIDTDTGRVTLVGQAIPMGETEELAFDMHDLGYIWLAPMDDFARDITISYTNGSTTITSEGKFDTWMVGKYVWLNDAWRKISAYVDADTLTLSAAMDATGSQTTDIVTMNEITFTGFTLSKLEMSYTPRMR